MTRDFTGHGGRLEAARRLYGGHDWLDLSTGINPCPWPVARAAEPDWARLPDPAAIAGLEAAAAGSFGVDPALCCAVPGSEVALRLLALLLGLPGRHVPPCYGTHAHAFPDARPATMGQGDRAAFVIANPNNPDGRIAEPATLLAWEDRIAAAGGWLLVDEAYAETVPAISLAPQVAADRRLVVLRSFGKFFGLAGVRLGFVVAPPSVLARLRHRLGDWPVSAAAVAFGTAAYRDAAWMKEARADIDRRAAALDAVLARHGLSPRGGCPLFRLVETAEAPALFDRLARHAILTRPFAEAPHWIRFGGPMERDLDRLDAALGNG